MRCSTCSCSRAACPSKAECFNAAADDIRRLLHQFAAGFLKEPNAQLLEQLQAILQTEVTSGMAQLEDEAAEGEGADAVEAPAPLAVAQALPSAQPATELDRDQLIDDAIAHAVASSVDDDIDVLDIIDPDLFPIFEEEALELLPTLGAALRQWSARPENLGARSELLRALHTQGQRPPGGCDAAG